MHDLIIHPFWQLWRTFLVSQSTSYFFKYNLFVFFLVLTRNSDYNTVVSFSLQLKQLKVWTHRICIIVYGLSSPASPIACYGKFWTLFLNLLPLALAWVIAVPYFSKTTSFYTTPIFNIGKNIKFPPKISLLKYT